VASGERTFIGCQLPVVSEEWRVASGEWRVASGERERTVIGCQLSVASGGWLVASGPEESCQLSVASEEWAEDGCQWRVASGWWRVGRGQELQYPRHLARVLLFVAFVTFCGSFPGGQWRVVGR
jgi:hypothetical protein